jgi:type I restriction enzyme S subunit
MNTKQLRQKILDLAIRGKLVPQDPTDEPASVLLERIKTEREKLIKEGKIKADKRVKDVAVTRDNSHYGKLPENWTICRLEEISESISAGGDRPKIVSNTSSVKCNIPIYSNGIKDNGLYGYTDNAVITKPSITVSARGTIGFCCVRFFPFTPIVRLITITPFENVIDLDYLNFFFCYSIPQGEGSMTPQLTVPTIKPKFIPLPPLAEQKRIADTVKKLFQILDSISSNIAK